MLPRRIPFNQIAFATLVGVGGGIYIYRPMFEPPRKPTKLSHKMALLCWQKKKEKKTELMSVLSFSYFDISLLAL
uniref:Protein PIGBOS1 n=1 Tax=Pygocentrus nattereri TaxID=42514 RepID=A0AAR2KD11_PYGNA